LPANVAVRYQIGIPTKPKVKGTLLTAYRTLEDARQFVRDYAPKVIYRAEAKISRAKFVAKCRYFIDLDYAIEDCWDPKRKAPIGLESGWPEGTVFCTEITLLERVT
jgi:hypothetical protein